MHTHLFQTFIAHLLTAFSVHTYATGPRLAAPSALFCRRLNKRQRDKLLLLWQETQRPLRGFREASLTTAGDKLHQGAKSQTHFWCRSGTLCTWKNNIFEMDATFRLKGEIIVEMPNIMTVFSAGSARNGCMKPENGVFRVFWLKAG